MHEVRVQARRAAAEELELALEWALLHPCPATDEPASWNPDRGVGERVVALAGPGAPTVAELAPVELSAVLGVSHHAARQLLADALELGFRLPRLWDLVQEGTVPAHVARAISRETHDLSRDAALHADRLVSSVPTKVGLVRARRLVDEARLWHDPDRAVDDERRSREERHVTVGRTLRPATRDVHMVLDREDAQRLDRTLDALARRLGDLGDGDLHDVRRACAVGLLADPQRALDLLRGSGAAPATGGAVGGVAQVFLHVTPDDLAEHLEAGTGAAVVEGVGTTSLELVDGWLAGRRVVVRPVLDLCDTDATDPVDRHDAPEAMREVVVQTQATCVFPGCGRDSRGCDLDHVVAYVPPEEGGPPGQTHPRNLAPLCRTHHRAKTFAGWCYRRSRGGFTWTSPTGHSCVVPPDPRHRS